MHARPLVVDFYLYSSHEVAVWEPIWRALRHRGVDAHLVLEPPGIHKAIGSVPNPSQGWRDDKSGPVEPLVDVETHESLAALLVQRDLPWIEHSRVDADAVITTQGVGWLLHYRGLRIKTEYGASSFVDVYGHGPVNDGLDLVLAHGPFSAHAISARLPADRIRTVGYPKWSPALRSGLDRAAARELLELPPDRPLIAWLPTWAHNASIDEYADALAKLADDYLVVAKPHHNSVRFEAERLGAIDPRILVRADLHSLVELMLAADVVVADSRSGALAETVMADRPAVGLLPGVSPRENGIVEGLDAAVVWCPSAADLPAAVGDALSVDRSSGRAAWRRWLFADMAGRDDDAAAAAVIDAIHASWHPSTSNLPLAELDRLLDHADQPNSFLSAFAIAWPVWPGHPRLSDLLTRHRHTLEDSELLLCSQLVRTSGHSECCPIQAALDDRAQDPPRGVVAAAMLGQVFELDVTDCFVDAVHAVQPHDFAAVLARLDAVPSAIPAFVDAAATATDRCTALGEALSVLGAVDEAKALHDYGRTLVSR